MPFPGSEIYEQMARDGKLSGRDWENYTTFNPDQAKIVIVSEVQSPAQLLAALRRATAQFYLRPRLIARHLFHIRSVDARQMANGLWSVLPVLARRRVWSRVQRAR